MVLTLSHLKQNHINFVETNKGIFEKQRQQISFNSLVGKLCRNGKFVLFLKNDSFHSWYILIPAQSWKHEINVHC